MNQQFYRRKLGLSLLLPPAMLCHEGWTKAEGIDHLEAFSDRGIDSLGLALFDENIIGPTEVMQL